MRPVLTPVQRRVRVGAMAVNLGLYIIILIYVLNQFELLADRRIGPHQEGGVSYKHSS